jgi:hypothetical protein
MFCRSIKIGKRKWGKLYPLIEETVTLIFAYLFNDWQVMVITESMSKTEK